MFEKNEIRYGEWAKKCKVVENVLRPTSGLLQFEL
jgi:hypothetical protein